MTESTTIQAVRAVLEKFQDGYTHRDTAALDEFMQLFIDQPEVEIVGTGAIQPGDDEWCLGTAAVRELVKNDWEGWGDVRLDLSGARIYTRGEVAWCAMPATVTMHFEREESLQNYLSYMREVAADEEQGSAEDRLVEILRGATNTLFEVRRGETFVWPFRFTAVLVQDAGQWRFHQMQFSFATTRYPDVRLTGKE